MFTSAKMAANKVDFTRIKATYQDKTALANPTVGVAAHERRGGLLRPALPELPQQSQPLTFQTFIQSIDRLLRRRYHRQHGAEINNLRSSLTRTPSSCREKAAVKEAWFGVAAVEDFRSAPTAMPAPSRATSTISR